MREIVLDTETTGFDPDTGDRIVEIGAIELLSHVPTGKTYHQYVNPERAMPASAFEIHGLGDDFLRNKPTFRQCGASLLDFVGDARLVIHNAEFDMRFLNSELRWIKLPAIAMDRAICTVTMTRKKFPGAPASLDALCRRFGIDNSSRKLHGALLDAEILAEVYLELIGGRQPDFGLGVAAGPTISSLNWRPRPRPMPLAPRLTEAEAAAHAAFVGALGENSVWSKLS